MMHQSEFDAANVALSRATDKRKSLINIHKNRYTATLRWRDTKIMIFMTLAGSYTFLAIGICADGVSVCS